MTKHEAIRQTHQENTLLNLGFTRDEADTLRRISMTLHRWFELECGLDHGCIERDELTNRPFWLNSRTMRRTPVADREKGAMTRLARLMASHTTLTAYIQGDPRGAALYIIRPDDVPAGQTVESYYTRGVCVS